MKSVVAGVVCAVGVAVLLGAGIGAQEQPSRCRSGRPARRAQARAEERRAGRAEPGARLQPSQAARVLRPEDAGRRTHRARVEAKPDAKPDVKPEVKPEVKTDAKPRTGTPKPPAPPRGSGLNFANSDLAFSGQHLFIGNFNGFNVYDLADGRKPKLLASIVCPGGQGDVSVHGNLLVMSVEQTRGRLDCGTQGVEPAVSTERFRGVRVFDITDVKKPKQVAAVQTCRGSHTHTLVANPSDKANLYVYGSGTGPVRARGRALGLFGRRAQGRSEHRALQHRRHPDPDRRAREGPHRQPSAHLRRRGRRGRSPACGRVATTGPARRRPR